MSEDRCTVTELAVSQCAHCRPVPTPDPFGEPAVQLGPWFAAAYGGYCSGCGEWFDEGEEIRADGHGAWECCEAS